MIKYPVLIQRNLEGIITGFICPDLNFESTFSEGHTPEDLQEYIRQTLFNHINGLQQQERTVRLPKKLKLYRNYPRESNDIWTQAYIDIDLKKKFFEKFLPRFGLFSSIMTAITMAIVYFTAIEISAGSTAGIGLGIVGALSSTLMSVIMYYYSDTEKVSKKIGKKVDNALTNISDVKNYIKEPSCSLLTSNCASTVKMLSKLSVTALPIMASATLTLSHYQSVNSMGDELTEKNILTKDAYHIISLIMITFSLYSTFTFQMSFLPHIYELLDRLLDKKDNSNITAANYDAVIDSGEDSLLLKDISFKQENSAEEDLPQLTSFKANR